MMRVENFDRNGFEAWLTDQGVEVLKTTNDYEVIRFKTSVQVSIVYKNKTDRISSFTGQSKEAYEAFKAGRRWKPNPVIRKPMASKKPRLAERDGHRCFWCGKKKDIDDLTVEHILNKIDGGNDHMNNLTLACKSCNRKLGRMSTADKIKLRDTMHKSFWHRRMALRIFNLIKGERI